MLYSENKEIFQDQAVILVGNYISGKKFSESKNKEWDIPDWKKRLN